MTETNQCCSLELKIITAMMLLHLFSSAMLQLNQWCNLFVENLTLFLLDPFS